MEWSCGLDRGLRARLREIEREREREGESRPTCDKGFRRARERCCEVLHCSLVISVGGDWQRGGLTSDASVPVTTEIDKFSSTGQGGVGVGVVSRGTSREI